MAPEQGPGIQVTFGAVGMFRFENVSVPAQPLKLYPTAIDVSVSSEDTAKVIAVPCAVVPVHWPAEIDEADVDGAPGLPPQADAKDPASVLTQNTTFVRAHAAATPPATPVCVRIGPVLSVGQAKVLPLSCERRSRSSRSAACRLQRLGVGHHGY